MPKWLLSTICLLVGLLGMAVFAMVESELTARRNRYLSAGGKPRWWWLSYWLKHWMGV